MFSRMVPGFPTMIRLGRSVIPASPDTDTSPVLGPRPRPRVHKDAGPQCVDSRGRGCARPASEGSFNGPRRRPRTAHAREAPVVDLGGADAPARRLRAALTGRDGGPARPCARSQGRGCARPASEGSLDKSASRLDGIRASEDVLWSGRDQELFEVILKRYRFVWVIARVTGR